jgi:hypothetical protein
MLSEQLRLESVAYDDNYELSVYEYYDGQFTLSEVYFNKDVQDVSVIVSTPIFIILTDVILSFYFILVETVGDKSTIFSV